MEVLGELLELLQRLPQQDTDKTNQELILLSGCFVSASCATALARGANHAGYLQIGRP